MAAIVRRQLEHSIYASEGKISVVDLAAKRDYKDEAPRDYGIGEAAGMLPEPAAGYFRFAKIMLDPGVDILVGRMAAQIGETLWRTMHPDLGAGTPTDFLSRHLLISRDWVGIWSRRGVVVAFKPTAEKKIQTMESRFREMVSLARRVESFIESGLRPEAVAEGEELTPR